MTIRTICRTCEKLLDDSKKKKGDSIIHCGRHHIVGNLINFNKEKGGVIMEKGKRKVTKDKTPRRHPEFNLIAYKLYTNKDLTAKEALKQACEQTKQPLTMSMEKYPSSCMFSIVEQMKK